jgi:hypothetical protein
MKCLGRLSRGDSDFLVLPAHAISSSYRSISLSNLISPIRSGKAEVDWIHPGPFPHTSLVSGDLDLQLYFIAPPMLVVIQVGQVSTDIAIMVVRYTLLG